MKLWNLFSLPPSGEENVYREQIRALTELNAELSSDIQDALKNRPSADYSRGYSDGLDTGKYDRLRLEQEKYFLRQKIEKLESWRERLFRMDP